MKKTLALILAAMMVAGTSAVAFAVADPDNVRIDGSTSYEWDSDAGYYKESDGELKYGAKIAFDLVDSKNSNAFLNDSDEVKNLKAYADYKVGESLVAEKPTIQYRKVQGAKYHSWTYLKPTGDYTKTFAESNGTDYTTITVPYATIASDIGLTGSITDQGTASTVFSALQSQLDTYLTSNKTDGGSGHTWTTDEKNIAIMEIWKALIKEEDLHKDSSYRYVIEMELKDSTTTASKDLAFDLSVGRTANGAESNGKKHFEYTVSFDKNSAPDDYFSVDKENYVIDFDDCDVCDIEFMSETGNTSYALFTVDASGQGKENVGFSVKFNSEIAAKYPEANLEFLKFTASPVFNRTGELSIYAPEDSFIYEVTADGLKEIKNAEYDESSEAWVLKTRYLKSYVTSDVELDLSASSEASSSETSSSNPSTGGTTGTTEGNTNVKPNPNTGR